MFPAGNYYLKISCPGCKKTLHSRKGRLEAKDKKKKNIIEIKKFDLLKVYATLNK